MGLINFTIMSARFLNILSWPPLPFVYPLCFSIWAIESDGGFSYEQCLTYWILFCITSICERMISVALPWLPFWPYVRGIAFLLLAVPDFAGASYVYANFVRPHIKLESGECDTLHTLEERCDILVEEDEFFYDASTEVAENEREKTSERLPNPENDLSRSVSTMQSPIPCQERPKIDQRDWSCALCLVSTSSQISLTEHLHGKKHKLKEEELRSVELVAASEKVVNSTRTIRSNGMILVESFSQITRANFQSLSGLISSPSTKLYKWCAWTKPELGWIKLNTDGSVDKRNASFGGLFRDSKGGTICAYVSKTSTNDIFLAELWAIWRGLVLALSLRIKVLWVESDSMSVVRTINKEQQYGNKVDSCLKQIWKLNKVDSCLNQIWKLLIKFEKIKVSHSWRESNKAADLLSRMDLTGKYDVVLWPSDFPNSLWKIIRDDARGKWYYRRA